jgi:hypothetical protein
VEKKNPAEGDFSKPGWDTLEPGGRRYVTAVGRGGLESGAGEPAYRLWWFCLGSGDSEPMHLIENEAYRG